MRDTAINNSLNESISVTILSRLEHDIENTENNDSQVIDFTDNYGGCCRVRTYDPRLVRAMLSRLS